MKLFFVLGLMTGVLAFAACDGSGGGGGGDGGGGSASSSSSSTSGDPCGGLGCASIVSPLVLTVVDAITGVYVDTPKFTWNGNEVQAMCLPSADGGAMCGRWQIQFAYGGTYTIEVTAAGYTNASVTVDLGGPKPGECCGVGNEVDATVTMQAP